MILRRSLYCAVGLANALVFKSLPSATVLVAVGALRLQALGAAPTVKLPVLKPIGPASIQGRRLGRAGVTDFGAFSHSLTEPQERLTSVIRCVTGKWINPRARVRAAGYNQTQSRAVDRHQCAAIRAHPGRQNRPPAPPPRRAPWLMTSPACCPP
jgi:hypothetical protein